MLEKLESPEKFVAFASQRTERLMTVGAIAQLSIDPPERFYGRQLARVLLPYADSTLVLGVIRDLRDVGMISEHEKISGGRIIYERIAIPAWEVAQVAIRESGIVVPEFRENQEELNLISRGGKGWANSHS